MLLWNTWLSSVQNTQGVSDEVVGHVKTVTRRNNKYRGARIRFVIFPHWRAMGLRREGDGHWARF